MTIHRVSVAAVFWFLAAGFVAACDTPVYRYAMYRWEPSPYEVYYFHRGAIDEENLKIQTMLEDAAFSETAKANVAYVAVNLDEDQELRSVPADVRARWLANQQPQIPSYMVFSPAGVNIYQGQIDEATVKSMLVSPLRQQIGKTLETGKAVVMVLLGGNDKAANDAAKELLSKLEKDVAEGKVDLYSAPKRDAEPGEGKAPPATEIAFMFVDRSDEKERWLVDTLLSVEDDLRSEQFKGDPMVFPVFGRGRALPPYIGKGVSRDNLLDCIDFVSGACSCTVKEQNPGLDLLVQYDWRLASEKLAEKFGAEEGNEQQLSTADFFPDLIIPTAAENATDGSPSDSPDGNAASEAVAAIDPSSPDRVEKEKTDASRGEAGSPATEKDSHPDKHGVDHAVQQEHAGHDEASDHHAADHDAGDHHAAEHDSASHHEEVALNHSSDAAHSSPQDVASKIAFQSILVIGGGIGLALVVLFGLTFLVLRPR